MTNESRAARASAAVDKYLDYCGDSYDAGLAIQDLITDLGHLALSLGENPMNVYKAAISNYAYENAYPKEDSNARADVLLEVMMIP